MIPTFLHPQEDANCKPEIQFRAMESTKGGGEEIEMSAQQDLTLPITAKNRGQRKSLNFSAHHHSSAWSVFHGGISTHAPIH